MPTKIPSYAPFGDEHLLALGLGLAGAHRTGKTTICQKIAENNGCPFVQTSLSAIATEMGIKIGLDMPFEARIPFQEEGLRRLVAGYAADGAGKLFVTDRTPLDLAAYVITAWHPRLADEEQTTWADDYVARCIDATNEWFFQLAIVQPGIPWADAEQKGENIPFYREALNTTIIGLGHDEAVKPACHVVDRDCLHLNARVQDVTLAYSENMTDYFRANKELYPLQ